jgi:hypothetical protein
MTLPAGCGSTDGKGAATAETTATVGVTPVATGVATGSPSAVLGAARAFLALLGGAQKAAAVDNRTSANLAQWSDRPDHLVKRAGLRMDTLTVQQRNGVLGILRAGLSTEGRPPSAIRSTTG